jgi:hypothetical protein
VDRAGGAGGGAFDSRAKVEAYAAMLGAFRTMRKSENGIVPALVEGGGQVFTTTNALGLGVVAPRIRA